MIVTIGHSTLSQDGFLDLLAEDGVHLLWDVRSYPTSHWAWFRREQLERWLPAAGVEYVWAPALGGRRPAPPRAILDRSAAAEGGWREEGFFNYQWHMTSPEFLAAADELAGLGRRETAVAIMCAEGLWWRCHRSMIADYLVSAGVQVVHLQPKRLDHATALAKRLTRYDRKVLDVWRRHREGRREPGADDGADRDG